MATQIQLRRDTAANWTSTNPTLAQGEPGLETDTGKIKYGNGSSAWVALPYRASGGATGGGADEVFYENSQSITTSYTLTAGKNAMTAGPVTVASGATVTVPSGAAWVIV